MHSAPVSFARPLRIVIPGGSGQVGKVLSRYFQQRGCYFRHWNSEQQQRERNEYNYR